MAKILEVTDLCKTYITNKRQNNVLRNVNFSVDEGEMVAVMGPSGSGKSTLLYTVSGMDSMTAGTVLFGGKDISALKPNPADVYAQKSERARQYHSPCSTVKGKHAFRKGKA